MKKLLLVEGMSCNHCASAVINALKELDGVASVDVNLDTKEVEVKGENLLEDLLKETIEEVGYDVLKIK